MKTALIPGIGGQDGSYLAETLLEQGYKVYGLARRTSGDSLWRLKYTLDRITLLQGDLTDPSSLRQFDGVDLDEVYNEADQDHVGYSALAPKLSVDVTYGGVVNLLEYIRLSKRLKTKVFQPCSAMMLDRSRFPQNEMTPFLPKSHYACAKVAAYSLARFYRAEHGLFVSTGTLYNHDSVRRCGDYLLHKICKAAASKQQLILQDLYAYVDIGSARDYVEVIWKIMQLDRPEDFVVSTEKAAKILLLVKYVWKLFETYYSTTLPPAMSHTPEESEGRTKLLVGDCSKLKDFGIDPPKSSIYSVLDNLCDKYWREANHVV